MTTLATCLLIAMNLQQGSGTSKLEPQVLYSEAKLGDKAWKALTLPDKVTMSAITSFLDDSSRKVIVASGRSKEYSLTGPEVQVDKLDVRSIISALRSPTIVMGKFCGFSPDHVIVFQKGTDKFQLTTCFSCGDVMGQVNDVQIVFGPMPEAVKSAIYKGFSKKELAEAALAKRMPPNAIKALRESKLAEVLRGQPFNRYSTKQGSVSWDLVRTVDRKFLSRVYVAVLDGAYKEFTKLQHRSTTRQFDHAYKIRYSGHPSLELLMVPSSGFWGEVDGQQLDIFFDPFSIGDDLVEFFEGGSKAKI